MSFDLDIKEVMAEPLPGLRERLGQDQLDQLAEILERNDCLVEIEWKPKGGHYLAERHGKSVSVLLESYLLTVKAILDPATSAHIHDNGAVTTLAEQLRQQVAKALPEDLVVDCQHPVWEEDRWVFQLFAAPEPELNVELILDESLDDEDFKEVIGQNDDPYDLIKALHQAGFHESRETPLTLRKRGPEGQTCGVWFYRDGKIAVNIGTAVRFMSAWEVIPFFKRNGVIPHQESLDDEDFKGIDEPDDKNERIKLLFRNHGLQVLSITEEPKVKEWGDLGNAQRVVSSAVIPTYTKPWTATGTSKPEMTDFLIEIKHRLGDIMGIDDRLVDWSSHWREEPGHWEITWFIGDPDITSMRVIETLEDEEDFKELIPKPDIWQIWQSVNAKLKEMGLTQNYVKTYLWHSDEGLHFVVVSVPSWVAAGRGTGVHELRDALASLPGVGRVSWGSGGTGHKNVQFSVYPERVVEESVDDEDFKDLLGDTNVYGIARAVQGVLKSFGVKKGRVRVKQRGVEPETQSVEATIMVDYETRIPFSMDEIKKAIKELPGVDSVGVTVIGNRWSYTVWPTFGEIDENLEDEDFKDLMPPVRKPSRLDVERVLAEVGMTSVIARHDAEDGDIRFRFAWAPRMDLTTAGVEIMKALATIGINVFRKDALGQVENLVKMYYDPETGNGFIAIKPQMLSESQTQAQAIIDQVLEHAEFGDDDRVAIVGVFRKKEGKVEVLVCRREVDPEAGKWCIPGGHAHVKEKIEDAARREMEEETHLELGELQFVKKMRNETRDADVYVYGTFMPDGEKAKAGDDAEKLKWLPIDDLPELAFDNNALVAEIAKEMDFDKSPLAEGNFVDTILAELGVDEGSTSHGTCAQFSSASAAPLKSGVELQSQDSALAESFLAWHSSPYSFRKFDTSREGAHFGTREQAENLHKPGKKAAKPYLLDIQNPLRIRDLGVWTVDGIATELHRQDVINNAEADAIYDERNWSDERAYAKIKEILRAKGYDGFVYENEQEGEGDSYVAFFADQIKPFKASLAEAKQLSLTVKPGVDPKHAEPAGRLLLKFFQERGTARWALEQDWILNRVDDGWREVIYSFDHREKGQEAEVQPYTDATYTKKATVFRHPKQVVSYKDVVDRLAGQPLAFRGMSMEEWAVSKKRGYIESRGDYNLGQQQVGWTMFGKDFGTAHGYSSGFAPYDRTPTRTHPGVIIAVPMDQVKPAKEVDAGPEGEFAARQIPLDQVKGVWLVVPVQADTSFFELVVDKGTGAMHDGSRGSHSPKTVLVPQSGIALQLESALQEKKAKGKYHRDGLLIVFEGIDGAGKTTQLQRLARWLNKKEFHFVSTKWNDSRALSAAIWKGKQKKELTPLLFSLLASSDMVWRYEHVVKPALEQGKVVLADRYYYTSYVRDQIRGIDPELLDQVYADFREPDLIFHCKVPVEVAVERLLSERGAGWYAAGQDVGYNVDGKEASLRAYETDMDERYKALFANAKSVVEIDMDRPKSEIAKDIKRALRSKLGLEEALEDGGEDFKELLGTGLNEQSIIEVLARAGLKQIEASDYRPYYRQYRGLWKPNREPSICLQHFVKAMAELGIPSSDVGLAYDPEGGETVVMVRRKVYDVKPPADDEQPGSIQA